MCSACQSDDLTPERAAGFDFSSPKSGPVFALATPKRRKSYRTQRARPILQEPAFLAGVLRVLHFGAMRDGLRRLAAAWRFAVCLRRVRRMGRAAAAQRASFARPNFAPHRREILYGSCAASLGASPVSSLRSELGASAASSPAASLTSALATDAPFAPRCESCGGRVAANVASRLAAHFARALTLFAPRSVPALTLFAPRGDEARLQRSIFQRMNFRERVRAFFDRDPRHRKLSPATSHSRDDETVASASTPAVRATLWSAQHLRKHASEDSRSRVGWQTLPGGAERFPDEVLVTPDAIVEIYRGAPTLGATRSGPG
jgi:hypothetical protein